ncbi:MAG: tetratricopeptide repeat protein [Candidatus Omnitrophica bacterium]|nr:tetratricopeptide repeat protein [Candidatus Omnitrophota bacterium]
MKKLFFLILFCACLCVYFGYLDSEFVFDDQVLVVDNPLIKSARLLPGIFKTGIFEYWSGRPAYDQMYRPLQMLSYYLDYNLWGLNPAGFRLTNLLLHFFNSVLVFYFIFLLFKNRFLAQAASLLFLVHPVQISTVAYISARGDLLSGFFILSCCILFLNFLNSLDYRLYFLSLLAGFLAFFSRENALLLIFLLTLVFFISRQEKKKSGYLAGFGILYVVYFAIRFFALGPAGMAVHPVYVTGILALVNFYNIILHYLLLLFWPVNLRMFHSVPVINNLNFAFLSLAAAGVILFISALCIGFKKRWVWFSFFWFLLGMIPVYFCFDAYPAAGKVLMAESWLYLPSIGFFTAFCVVCLLYKQGRLIIYGCVLILSVLVFANSAYWRSEINFYERTAQFLPEDSFIRRNLAFAYIRKGDFAPARRLLQKLEKYYSDSPIMSSLWGQYYLAQGKPQEALRYFQRILVKSFFTNYSVSLCYSKLDDLERAIEFSRASFSLNSFYLPNLIQLAKLYSKIGQFDLADKYYALAKEYNPKDRQLLIK